MSDRATVTLIAALESVLAELAGLAATRTAAEPWDAALPEHQAAGARTVQVAIGGAEIERIIWILPPGTAESIAARMYFGMSVRDRALIDAAVTELFCRVTARSLETDGTLRIAAPPALDRADDRITGAEDVGVTVRFDSAAGPFTMNLLLAPV